MEKDLSVKVNGLDFDNPFVIASGPPGTNKATISKAFKEGWGGVVAKTISLESDKVHNVAPRYGKLYSRKSKEVIGFQNIELISDRPFDDWLKDFDQIKKDFPKKMLIASIMEEYDKDAWQTLVKKVQDTGVDALELNFSCPHGLPERNMGMAMGENPNIVKEVTGWVKEVSNIPVWSKMTPNLTDISIPSMQSIEAGADGIALINTILAVIGIDLKTLRPLPTVKGHSIPGGYSAQAVRPIALKHMLTLAKAIEATNNKHITISGMGGVECSADAIEFLLMGANTVQSCTAPMLQGFGMIHELISGTKAFMQEHNYDSIDEFRGHSLQYFTTHHHLVELKKGNFKNTEISKDTEWSGEDIANQTANISTN
ncbi:MAG: NAD-dependent dihydropyrimidine dehydrogenase subunit PreA [Bdellovibrionales bacterium]|jgi:dihydroorotate dehydrogenase subfamily 1|nr:NAD-dependent dihydropyrimidine dehydrogenase subunit PreA [Bdellovibrionales bacterium]